MVQLISTILLTFLMLSPDQEWKLRKQKDGIEIFTREVDVSELDEFKGLITIPDATLQDVLKVILDVDVYVEWFPDCMEAKILQKENKYNQVHYFSIKAPWPVKNREAVYKSITTLSEEGKKAYVELINVDGFVEEKKNFVRMFKGRGFWELLELPGNKVEVTYQFQSDPGGNIPAWLANMSVVSNPYNTLVNLRARIKDEK